MKMLNQSQELKTRELGQTKELTETIGAAEDKIKKLTSGSGRKIRQAEECEAILLYVNAMENYTNTNETDKMQEMANNIINAEVTSCPDDINSQLEENLAVFTLTKNILNEIINSLEAEIQEIQETIGVLNKELSNVENLLLAEFGLNLQEITLKEVDSSEEMPLALDPLTNLFIDYDFEFSEMPLALDFPVIDIGTSNLKILY